MKAFFGLSLLVVFTMDMNSGFAGTGVAGGGLSRSGTYRLEYGKFRSARELDSIMNVCSENIQFETQESMEADNLLVISEADFNKLPELAKFNGILELVQFDGKTRRYRVWPSFSPAMYQLIDVSKMNSQNSEIDLNH